MKVLLLPADTSGCGYYRMTEPARALREQCSDVEIEIAYNLDVDGEYVRGSGQSTRIHSVDPHGADVVVFQRPTNQVFPQVIPMLQAQGVAVVVEIDDLMGGVSRAHAGHRELVQEGVSRLIIDCVRLADLVTVSTPGLLKYYGTHSPGRVIPNAIPRRIAELPPAYELRPSPDRLRIGWTGSVFTHPHDLQVIGTGLRTALDSTGEAAQFSVMGQSFGAQDRLGLVDAPTELPWVVGVDRYLTAIGDSFDIGLAPLRTDKFNECKSWLKPLEYAARGIYPVRSVTQEYERLGLGWRATSPKDWAKGIRIAITDSDRRQEVAVKAREMVLGHHLTEHTAELWLSAWRAAADSRAGSKR